MKYFVLVIALISSNLLIAQQVRVPGPTKKIPKYHSEGPIVSYSYQFSVAELEEILQNCGVVQNLKFIGGGTQCGAFETESSSSGIPKGLILSSGSITNASGPNESGSTGNAAGGLNDPDLDIISKGFPIFDAGGFEFDLIATKEYFTLWTLFGSDEYPEYACSIFNDVFGCFMTGPNLYKNISTIPGTDIPIRINTINAGVPGSNGMDENCSPPLGYLVYSGYYVDNPIGSPDFEFDGYTLPLLIQAPMILGETYHFKFVIGDSGDAIFDSALSITSDTFQVNGIAAPIVMFQNTCHEKEISLQNKSRYSDTYLWEFGDGTTSTLANPAPHKYAQEGTYTVSLKASNKSGLSTTKTKVVKTDPVLELSNVEINTSNCNKAGEIHLLINSNTPTISYQWTDQSMPTSVPTENWVKLISRDDLVPGTYSLKVWYGTVQKTFGPYTVIKKQVSYGLNPTIQKSCGDANKGVISLNLSGNFESILWSNGNNMNATSASNLSSGEYQVTITDKQGCVNTYNYTVPSNLPKVKWQEILPANCLDEGGKYVFELINGDPTYNIAMFRNGLFVKDFVSADVIAFENIQSGLVEIRIKDALGCEINYLVDIPKIPAPKANVLSSAADLESNLVNLSVFAKDGIPPLSYKWSDGYDQSVRNNFILKGQYTITVTDKTGCTGTTQIIATSGLEVIHGKFTIFPNPAKNSISIRTTQNSEMATEQLEFRFFDNNGQMLLSKFFNSSTELIMDTSIYPAGLYFGELLGKQVYEKQTLLIQR